MPWAIFGVFLIWAYIDFRRYAQPLDDSKPALLWTKKIPAGQLSCFRVNGFYFKIDHFSNFKIYKVWIRKVGRPVWKELVSRDYPELQVFADMAKAGAIAKPGQKRMTKEQKEAQLINDLFHPSPVPDNALSRAENITDQERGLSRLTGEEVTPESVST